jgi:RNA polymerase sigma factor (sigma-70 family)
MSLTDTGRSTSRARSLLRRAEAAPPEDRVLVRDCLKGKEEAWSKLIVKYKNLVYSVPLRLGLTPDDAAEVFQAVCFDLVSELERLRDPKALPAWLLRVSYHKSLRHKRENERFVATESELDSGPPEAEVVPEDLTRDVEQTALLQEAVAGLSPRCQELIRRLFFDTPPQPYEAVAASLGLSRGSIAFMRSRCLKRLRSRLEKGGFVLE